MSLVAFCIHFKLYTGWIWILRWIWGQYLCYKLIITPTTIVGAPPLTLPFQAIFDRLPVGNKQEIVLDAAALMSIESETNCTRLNRKYIIESFKAVIILYLT